jgi:hypothetical protein
MRFCIPLYSLSGLNLREMVNNGFRISAAYSNFVALSTDAERVPSLTQLEAIGVRSLVVEMRTIVDLNLPEGFRIVNFLPSRLVEVTTPQAPDFLLNLLDRDISWSDTSKPRPNAIYHRGAFLADQPQD